MSPRQLLLGLVFLAGVTALGSAQGTATGAGNQTQAPGRVRWKMDHYSLPARDWDWVLQIDTVQISGGMADL